jgi:hypothetical protein
MYTGRETRLLRSKDRKALFQTQKGPRLRAQMPLKYGICPRQEIAT